MSDDFKADFDEATFNKKTIGQLLADAEAQVVSDLEMEQTDALAMAILDCIYPDGSQVQAYPSATVMLALLRWVKIFGKQVYETTADELLRDVAAVRAHRVN